MATDVPRNCPSPYDDLHPRLGVTRHSVVCEACQRKYILTTGRWRRLTSLSNCPGCRGPGAWVGAGIVAPNDLCLVVDPL